MRLVPLLIGLAFALPVAAESFDLVLANGRVMDPETGLDAPRNVGIREGRIARISAEALSGTRRIDVKGLVVAPGFVDLHQHAQDPASSRLKAFDGVTTGLEMEIGVPDVVSFLSRKQGTSLINYGTTASHPAARAFAFGTPLAEPVLVAPSGPATNTAATPEIRTRIAERLGRELDAGALGIGMGIQYTPGATRQEVID
ncbi:MAG: D-glutamate deacylase, partial [Gammaproteobacteria bacterium]